MSSTSITMIKKDAVINVPISAGLVAKIQQILAAMISEQTEEELDTFKKLVLENPSDYSEEWMGNIVTLTYLMQIIESEAVKQGYTYQKDITQPEN